MQKKTTRAKTLDKHYIWGKFPSRGPSWNEAPRLQGLGAEAQEVLWERNLPGVHTAGIFFWCLLIKEGQFSHVAPQSVTWSWFLVLDCGAWLVTPQSWCEIKKKNRSAKFHSYVLTFPRTLPQNTYNSTIYLITRPLNALNEDAEVYTDVKLQDLTKVPWKKLNVQWQWSHFLALNARIV